MLFIFYIILSTSLYCILEINAFSVHNKNEVIIENEINSSFNDSEIVTESGSVMSKHKSLFYIIQNPSDAPNLKSNIFDKMLSNEMLSIKQQLYEKNETNVSPIYLTFKNSIATPTLELKQRWPIDKTFTPSEIKNKKEHIIKKSQFHVTTGQSFKSTPPMDNNDYDDNNKLNDSIKNKVLGVRSFSAMTDHHLEGSNSHQYTKRQCSCMKTNQRTTCSLRCSEHKKKTCTQTENCVTEFLQCSRNLMPFTYYPYHVYSTLFLGVTADSSVLYYHPDVINELKLPKHKYSQIKKPSIDNLYFENIDDKYEDEYLEYENSDEEKPKKTKYPKYKCEKGKADKLEKAKPIYSIHYREDNSILEEDKFSDGYLQVLDRDKFIEDVVEDLKVYYSDAVIKDCYCSLSSFKFRTESLINYLPMFVILIMYSIFNIERY